MDFKIIWYGWDLTGSATGPVAGSFEHSNESWRSMEKEYQQDATI